MTRIVSAGHRSFLAVISAFLYVGFGENQTYREADFIE